MLRTIHENGKIYVLVPEKKYQQMCEMSEELQDIAAYDYARSLEEEAFPMVLFDAVDAGRSAVAVFREYRGLTPAALAKAANISAAYLNQIEHGSRTGSAKTLRTIADALDVDVDILL